MTSARHVTLDHCGGPWFKRNMNKQGLPLGRSLGCRNRNDWNALMRWVHGGAFKYFQLSSIGKGGLVHFCAIGGIWPVDGTIALSSLASDSSSVGWLHWSWWLLRFFLTLKTGRADLVQYEKGFSRWQSCSVEMFTHGIVSFLLLEVFKLGWMPLIRDTVDEKDRN